MTDETPALGPSEPRLPLLQRIPPLVRAVGIVAVLYIFLASIKLMGAGFQSMGAGFAERLIATTSNPFVGLFVGILATSIAQSSSLTTSIVVGMVSVGTLNIQVAIPIVMGANIGTTVTSCFVAFGFVGRRDEFERAFACATMCDFFKLLSVAIQLPVELITRAIFGVGWLEWSAGKVAGLFCLGEGCEFAGPVKHLVSPLVRLVSGGVNLALGEGTASAWVQVVVALLMLFLALWAVTKLMKSLMVSRFETVLDRTLGRSLLVGFISGALLTAIIQSSSVTVSMLVPLAAAGIMDLRQMFPVAVGANVGTTVTALMAALGGAPLGLSVAMVHVIFSVTTTAIFLPIPAMRRLPIGLAEGLARLTRRSRWYAVGFVVMFFFGIPCMLIFLT